MSPTHTHLRFPFLAACRLVLSCSLCHNFPHFPLPEQEADAVQPRFLAGEQCSALPPRGPHVQLCFHDQRRLQAVSSFSSHLCLALRAPGSFPKLTELWRPRSTRSPPNKGSAAASSGISHYKFPCRARPKLSKDAGSGKKSLLKLG